jgi:DNA-binding NtrC family response regulator
MLADTAAIHSAATSRHVLVIEDDSLIRQVLEAWLAQAGWHVTTAADAETALAVHANLPSLVVVCDMSLGDGPNGLWISEQLLERRSDVAILLSSGDVTISEIDTLPPGITGHLVKPFGSEDLIREVQRATDYLLRLPRLPAA